MPSELPVAKLLFALIRPHCVLSRAELKARLRQTARAFAVYMSYLYASRCRETILIAPVPYTIIMLVWRGSEGPRVSFHAPARALALKGSLESPYNYAKTSYYARTGRTCTECCGRLCTVSTASIVHACSVLLHARHTAGTHVAEHTSHDMYRRYTIAVHDTAHAYDRTGE